MTKRDAQDLFGGYGGTWELPADFQPLPLQYFSPQAVILSKGSLDSPERERFVRRICATYPEAAVIEQLDVPHNRIDLKADDSLQHHRQGKRTLVLGELKKAVRFSEEEDNTCPNYWHFSVYGFCPYGCKYCYLAGTHGVWFSPTVKIYVNLPEILDQVDRIAQRHARPIAFYHGKLQDGLALDPLTAYSTVLVPFFAQHPYARQVLLTKSANVDRLLELNHSGHTILSWSLNPPEIIERYEQNVPSLEERLDAMRRCGEAGYPLRAVIMPMIPHPDWERQYTEFLERLLGTVRLQRLTLGGICIYRQARRLMEAQLGRNNAISGNMNHDRERGDGRARYHPALRARMYQHLTNIARDIQPDLELALCLEEPTVWESVQLIGRQGHCNCVL